MYAHINPVSGGVDRNHRYSARNFFFNFFLLLPIPNINFGNEKIKRALIYSYS